MIGIEIRDAGRKGQGVFATRAFTPGEHVYTLGGRRLSLIECAAGVASRRIRVDDPLQIGPNLYIALDDVSIRFNHSCDANCDMVHESDLIANRNIAVGDEITFDYSLTVRPSFYSWAWNMKCACGAANCRHVIGNLDTVPRDRLNTLLASGRLQSYITEHLARTRKQFAPNQTLSSVRTDNGKKMPPTDQTETTRQRSDHSYLLPGSDVGFLLIHGLSGTPVEMRYIADRLHAAGYTVSAPQLAGHCGTYDDLKATRWQDWAASCETALHDLSKRCRRIYVGGLSTGAILSLHLAAKFPDIVTGTVLYAPTLWLNGWVVPKHAYLFNLVVLRRVADMFDFPDLPPHGIKDPEIRKKVHDAIQSGDSSLAGMPVTPGRAVLEHRWLVNSVRKQLNKITRPVLIIHPREDDYADLNNIAYLLRHLRSEVETMTLNDSYHIITTDRQKERVAARTLEFMAKVEREAGAGSQPRQIPSTMRAASGNGR